MQATTLPIMLEHLLNKGRKMAGQQLAPLRVPPAMVKTLAVRSGKGRKERFTRGVVTQNITIHSQLTRHTCDTRQVNASGGVYLGFGQRKMKEHGY